MKLFDEIINKYRFIVFLIVFVAGILVLAARDWQLGNIIDALTVEILGVSAFYFFVFIPERKWAERKKLEYHKQHLKLASVLLQLRLRELRGQRLSPNEEADRIIMQEELRRLNYEFNQPPTDIEEMAQEFITKFEF